MKKRYAALILSFILLFCSCSDNTTSSQPDISSSTLSTEASTTSATTSHSTAISTTTNATPATTTTQASTSESTTTAPTTEITQPITEVSTTSTAVSATSTPLVTSTAEATSEIAPEEVAPEETAPEETDPEVLKTLEQYEVDSRERAEFQERVSDITLPVINVYTEDRQRILSREDYVNCIVDVFNCDDEYIIDAAEAGIRVRGNSTAFYGDEAQVRRNLVPYRIKFDKKQNMLGLNDGAECKSWVLLKTQWNILPDYFAFRLAEQIFEGKYYSTDCMFTYLYVNGRFTGLYLLCEQNQINKHRVNIPEVEEGYTGTDIAYFLELDNYATDNPYYFTTDYCSETLTDINGTTRELVSAEYTIKNDIYSQQQVDHISKYLSNVYKIMVEAIKYERFYMFDENYDLVSAEGVYDNAYDTINAVIDLESVLRMYILYEICHDYDCGEGSFFMAIDFSGESEYNRLTFTAPWDFNWAYGDSAGGYYAGAFNDMNFVNQYGDRTNPWFVLLMSTDWFYEMVTQRWQELYNNGNISAALNDCNELIKESGEDLQINGVCYLDNAEQLLSWIKTRVRWLNKKWGA